MMHFEMTTRYIQNAAAAYMRTAIWADGQELPDGAGFGTVGQAQAVLQMPDAEPEYGPHFFLVPRGMTGKDAVALFSETVEKVKEIDGYQWEELLNAVRPLGFRELFEDFTVYETGVEW